jgi:hypothetical protein
MRPQISNEEMIKIVQASDLPKKRYGEFQNNA